MGRAIKILSLVTLCYWLAAPGISAGAEPAKPTLRRPVQAPSPVRVQPQVEAPPTSEKAQQETAPVETKGKPQPDTSAAASQSTLSPEQAALKERIQKTALVYFQRPMNVADNTPAEVLLACVAFGCDTTVRTGQSTAAINAIGCLCWNYPCAGRQLLRMAEDGLVAQVGYGLQQQPGEFLAVLAQAAVPAEYEIRVGDEHRTVRDLVEAEKRNCRAGMDLSQRLIGLSFYADDKDVWKNRWGEEWSIPRMLAAELDRQVASENSRATDRLMGLSMALAQRLERKRPVDGEFQRADGFINEFQQHALALQNSDGSWHPGFFAYQGSSSDSVGVLNSTGRILQWLAFSLPEDQLHDPAIVRSVNHVIGLLNNSTVQQNVALHTLRGTGGVMHAIRALGIYSRRALQERKSQG